MKLLTLLTLIVVMSRLPRFAQRYQPDQPSTLHPSGDAVEAGPRACGRARYRRGVLLH
jgi:hypothetical protein